MIRRVDLKVKKGAVSIEPSPDNIWHWESQVPYAPREAGDTLYIDADGPLDARLLVPPLDELNASLGRGPLRIRDVASQRADINSGLGNLDVLRSEGAWRLNVGKGDAFIDQFAGTLHVNLGMGRLDMRQVTATADINNGLGPLSGSACDGSFTMNTGKGDVTWANGQGSLQINTGMGTIDVHSADGENLTLRTGFGKVSLDGGVWQRAEVETGLGDVHVSSRVSDLAVHIKQRGHIRAELARDLGARIEASTERGRIISHLHLLPVGHAGPHRGQRVVGTLGDGSGRIQLQTRRGDVTLSQPSAEGEQDIEQERLLILEQLQHGALSVEEAESRLELLEY